MLFRHRIEYKWPYSTPVNYLIVFYRFVETICCPRNPPLGKSGKDVTYCYDKHARKPDCKILHNGYFWDDLNESGLYNCLDACFCLNFRRRKFTERSSVSHGGFYLNWPCAV